MNGHPVYDCTQCHNKPTDALSSGHALDPTPEAVEVDLSHGWSWEGGYDRASQTCDNNYFRGDGQTPSGVIAIPIPVTTCPSMTSSRSTRGGG